MLWRVHSACVLKCITLTCNSCCIARVTQKCVLACLPHETSNQRAILTSQCLCPMLSPMIVNLRLYANTNILFELLMFCHQPVSVDHDCEPACVQQATTYSMHSQRFMGCTCVLFLFSYFSTHTKGKPTQNCANLWPCVLCVSTQPATFKHTH